MDNENFSHMSLDADEIDNLIAQGHKIFHDNMFVLMDSIPACTSETAVDGKCIKDADTVSQWKHGDGADFPVPESTNDGKAAWRKA